MAGTLSMAFQGCSHCGSESHLDVVVYLFCSCPVAWSVEEFVDDWFQERVMGTNVVEEDFPDSCGKGTVLDGGSWGFLCTKWDVSCVQWQLWVAVLVWEAKVEFLVCPAI